GGAVRDGLLTVSLPGRFQVLPGRPAVVVDVAHNPHAARVLGAATAAMGFYRETYAVFAMLADKDIAGRIAAMAPRIDRCYVASLPGTRGASADTMRARLAESGIADNAIRRHDEVACAFDAARADASEADRIIVFGSFLTVAAVLEHLGRGSRPHSRHG